MSDIAAIRQEYTLYELLESDIAPSPFTQFQNWFAQAQNAALEEVNAMTLSTVSIDGRPSSRIVLLKGLDNEQFVFYTNYESAKAKDIAANSNVALLFFWKELQRQVRIEGTVSKLDEHVSSIYFNSRPYESQIGAWASEQSAELDNRSSLEAKFEAYKRKYPDLVPKPPHWGGYAVTPSRIEFWQGRKSRLHDRLVYSKLSEAGWKITRLNP